jgi:hypothetical protein
MAVAVSYGFRLVFALSLALLVVAVSSLFFAAGGVPWPTLFERLEPFAGTAFVLLMAASRLGVLGGGFDVAARRTALVLLLGALLMLANLRGFSLLTVTPSAAQVFYQILFVPVALVLLWRSLRGGDTVAVNLVATAFALFVCIRYLDWFWDWLPAWLFFLALAAIAFAGIGVLRRLRGSPGAA